MIVLLISLMEVTTRVNTEKREIGEIIFRYKYYQDIRI